MIKQSFATFCAEDNKLQFDRDSGYAVFIIEILITLTLMTVIVMKMFLKLLFISNFWLGIKFEKRKALKKR